MDDTLEQTGNAEGDVTRQESGVRHNAVGAAD